MGWTIIFAPQAIADLEAVVRFIATDDPFTAERIGNELIDRVAILKNFPLLGSPYAKRPGVRRLVSRPYIIYYRVREASKVVDVLRFWHGARSEPPLD